MDNATKNEAETILGNKFARDIGVDSVQISLNVPQFGTGGKIAHIIEIEGDSRQQVTRWLAALLDLDALVGSGRVEISAPEYDAECDSTIVRVFEN